jgi:hypothetical protein
MSWKYFIFAMSDVWRKLWYHPVVYCLYEKTRKRQVTWDKAVTLRDGDIWWKFEWPNYGYERELNGYDMENSEQIFSYGSWGVDSLYSLIVQIENEPTELRRKNRIKKYLEENC